MLELHHIVKVYGSAGADVVALQGIDLAFRKSEFVSVLGPSGCGKTTLLNIIGGLDHYTDGDLVINRRSTREFSDADWDAYRNHSIGFVFQNYNLIPHQTVLANVELALTLSGVGKAERRERAAEALRRVGLGDQLHKKPNQMSGGQMQRVAIARALVNDPDILLADEPTGALDSVTSVQIMEILKEISKDKLIIMVTHNPDLASQYSSRVIRLLDGRVVGDTAPVTEEELAAEAAEPILSKAEQKKSADPKVKKTSMSFFTALSLSFNNLMTKKARTFLTSFAGSIGIIGIALILSVSTGVDAYINSVESSTMASYPLTIQESTMDTTSMMASMMTQNANKEEQVDGRVYSNDVMVTMMQAMSSGLTSNDLKKFKVFLDNDETVQKNITDIKYSYSVPLNTYTKVKNADGTFSYKRNLSDFSDLLKEIGVGGSSSSSSSAALLSNSSSGSIAWSELIGNDDYVASQYEVVHGRLPGAKDEVVLIVDENKQISDYVLYMLGIRDIQEIKDYVEASNEALAEGKDVDYTIPSTNYSYEELCEYSFVALTPAEYYTLTETAGKKSIREANELEINERLESNGYPLRIVGIITPSGDSIVTASIGAIGYRTDTMAELIARANDSAVVKAQKEDPDTDLFTGAPFKGYTLEDATMLRAMIKMTMPAYAAMVDGMSDQQIVDMANANNKNTYDGNMEKLGYVDAAKPSSIRIYPKDFEAKDKINEVIRNYNETHEENERITYTDTVALLMSSITTIVDAISYVLIAFVAISLIVSSIMIGIITYISVLERTKEIGILRAIGASKGNVANVFNAETLTIGFVAGLIGIGASLLFDLIINIILHALTGIPNLNAVLPWEGALFLVALSMFLTFIAGLFPSGVAAKKDPVVALRTE